MNKIHKTFIKNNQDVFKFINDKINNIIEIKPIKKYKGLFNKKLIIDGYRIKYEKMI